MDIKSKIESLNCILSLERKIVGVKFIFNNEEFDAIEIPRVKYKLSYCNMVKFASKGKCLKANLDNFNCVGSAKALGLKEPDSNAISGRTYFSFGLYDSLCTARNVQKDVTFLNHRAYGITVMPLEKFEDAPDVVIFIVNPYQGMRIVQGYAYHHGMLKNIKIAGNSGMCSECTATPYETNDINISLLCSNTRFAAKWGENELGIGLPFNKFESLYDGIVKTINPSEPENKKEQIIRKCKEQNINLNVTLGTSYYKSGSPSK